MTLVQRIQALGTRIATEMGKVRRTSITIVIDGTVGVKGDLEIPFACTIERWTLLADQPGSAVVNIWRDTYANFPPTDGGQITGSSPPTLMDEQKAQSSVLTGWTTTIAAGDILRFNVDSASTITQLTLSLKVVR